MQAPHFAVAVIALGISACVSSSAPNGDYPEIDLSTAPAYLGHDVVVLTFDDGPDTVNTPKVLDFLAQEKIPAAFFINTDTVNAPVLQSVAAQAIVKRIVKDGYELGNHSIHHKHLNTLSAEEIEEELAGVEVTVRDILGNAAPRMTLVRAPFGDPYLFDRPEPEFSKVAAVVARHGVHIGWAIDPTDYNCPTGDADCVFNNAKRELDAGKYGIILLHSVHSQTAAALPRIVNEIRGRGMHFAKVEDVVRARFGQSSAELYSSDTSVR